MKHFVWFFSLLPFLGFSQSREIEFPDIPGYQTLKCDFHIHSVFSDGSVWPDIRVQEAVKDGLDAISLTEHIEYQPHIDDIPHQDRNRSYEIAKELAKPHDLIVVHGVEITRDMPPGHANAIFIQDANLLDIHDPIEAYREANRQGAFVFWNHPNWVAQYRDGVAKLTEMHRTLIEEDLLHGIEVVNDLTYSDEAFQLVLDNDLTVLGTSDIHGLVDWQFMVPDGGHRPICLVFSEDRTEDGIKEALFDQRTVAWFRNQLIGHEKVLQPLIKASLEIADATYQGPSSVMTVKIRNNSDAQYMFKNHSEYTLHSDGHIFTVEPNAETKIEVKTLEQLAEINLELEVLNAYIGPNQHPRINLLIRQSD